jgi:hypothetical protein
VSDIREWVEQYNGNALLADGFEAAFIGMAKRCSEPALAVYDALKCVEILIERDGMEPEEALEFFEFNTAGAWVGENTPLFLWRYEEASG